MTRSRSNQPVALAFAACALLLASPAVAAEMPERAGTCADCHGENGVSDEPEIPTIAGASAFFIENQLIIYQEEARPCAADVFEEKDEEPAADSHCALASELSEDEVVELAEYFASQPFAPADQPFDQALAEQGESIHERNCDKCHTEGGSLDLDDAGILAGQWKPYLIEQMKFFKAGERWQPEKMQPKMEELSEADIEALAEYYASQGPERFQ